MAEVLLNRLGDGCFHAFSAGSHPAGQVNPLALAQLEIARMPTDGLCSKNWEEFAQPDVPPLDFVFTVCDDAAGEVCPVWPGQPMTAQWGIEDPAAVQGSEEQRRRAFSVAFSLLRRRILRFVSLPISKIDGMAFSGAPLSVFERYLTVWVLLCIVAGIGLGQLAPVVFQAVGRIQIARVNLPVGVLIWVMIIPMLVKVDFGALHALRQHVRGIGVTLFVNWLVKPFSMAFLGWLFVRHLFAPLLPAGEIDSYIAGLILLVAAPCMAMVFVWSRLTNGDPLFTLT